ncbi:hypothetical protein ACQJBY_028441 [Aegilops geniculata]
MALLTNVSVDGMEQLNDGFAPGLDVLPQTLHTINKLVEAAQVLPAFVANARYTMEEHQSLTLQLQQLTEKLEREAQSRADLEKELDKERKAKALVEEELDKESKAKALVEEELDKERKAKATCKQQIAKNQTEAKKRKSDMATI